LPANDPPLELDPPRACPAEISPGLDELVEREFADVYLLIDHLSGRADRKVGTIELEGCPEPGQKANLIDQVCQVRWPASGDQPKPANQAAVLFKARDKLSELAAPATGLTVAYTLRGDQATFDGRDLSASAEGACRRRGSAISDPSFHRASFP